MQTPQRKPGKYTGIKADPNITQAKYNELEAKLEKLKHSTVFAIAEVKRLAADGDFSENHAYSMAKGRLRGINQRILDIEDHLRRANIIHPQANSETVQLGSLVTVEINNKQKTFQILGSAETNPNKGIISNNSPIGAALMGKRVGGIVQVRAVVYRVIKIN
ncbi:MAG: Transcription elongation factor GreA [Candidatus Falkowbacteria bacterium GW2011_GWC2_38_22]|uniref:Transcription elongation factor GreA n=1 Tax=Candidatus Falkowbacteria bacterium GW2011_GWE1_38_31 TaxID=1618638 RepID=A0A0G0MYI1_9BACT|nr:MAG: Transcription elongation factor GreA [Candidatus Falkowbacteria bacterium GW2011_GWF2_38_1205]KKQ61125.1 MAG: Transcription elongation factor GreA [Candidatus Falkowbacteria bacterium GW2011_GWC2_38_22]KKQ63194.1 MAG: Transcription elongation factor GreA [Candidatus Falkowbacteria bacterium GW2011_GWF1_38_22]KKQ65389.1 MAG: Transcription elongation factor GreA [Candidatus Falkowbacteria bacterium GW2011_GWE2_38_254]KKQ69966.1 MAG: Transcription elongation factor GreA [Candidatus Falkowb